VPTRRTAPTSPDNRIKAAVTDAIGFLTEYVRNPLQVGSLMPSSRALVSRMLDGVDLSHARIIVEFGPGTGALTGPLLDRMPLSTLYYALEPNPAFRILLRRRFPRVRVIGDSAEMAAAHLSRHAGEVDAVFSGIPFSLMSRTSLEKTVASTARLLKPGGDFRTFVYQHVYHLPKLVELRRLLVASHRSVGVVPVLANLPPALVLQCVK
jgi:phosphatidylethanolamine/phosphatidyl-N-methylethanolamine N-methyltransferase